MKIEELLTDPRWLPHKLDWERQRVTFLPTARETLREMSFIDGREDFSTGPAVEASLEDLLATAGEGDAPESRFIFHVSFCGSTLLARLLDQPGKVLALSEPNILVDLADWKAILDADKRQNERFLPAIRLMLGLLQRRWQPGEAVLLKPSNWVNNIIPGLAQQPDARSVFIGMDARTFILALFRGGRDRLAYNARAISHIAMGDPPAEQMVRTALSSSRDPFEIMARLGALSHRIQMDYFRRAGAGDTAPLLDFTEITTAPAEAAARTAEALGLPPPQIAPEQLGINAKQRDQRFSREERRQTDAQIEHHYGALADAAIAWAAAL